MATLSAEVQIRISNTLLVQLTNKHETAPSTVNTTILDAAAEDASAEFEIETGVALDTSIKSHVAAGVQGTIYYLHEYNDVSGAAHDRRRQRWENVLRKLEGTVGAGTKILPSSTSTLEESEQPDGRRPDFDRERWRDIVPDPPRGGDETGRRIRGF